MSNIVHLMTSSPMRHGGNLQKPDEMLWLELKNRKIAGQCFMPQEVSVIFKDQSVKLFVNDKELEPGSLLIRSTRDVEERTYEVALAYESLGNLIIDPIESLVYPVGKLIPFIKRKEGINQPTSIFFIASNHNLDIILENLSFPFIVKPQKGYAGTGVKLIQNELDFNSYIKNNNEELLIAQEYIANIESEFRVIVIDGKAIGAVKKISNNVAKNAAQGALFEPATDTEVMSFAEKVVSLEKGKIYGTDIAKTISGELYLIENNRSPNFEAFREATGIAVESVIIDFIESQPQKF